MINQEQMSIMIVEDEAGVRRALRNKLRWEELNLYIAQEAQNAEEAYELIKVTPPAIMLLDMRMPGMGGFEFLKILEKEFPDIKVIILSGHNDFEYIRQALRCGANDYLLKPVVKEDLTNALSKAIREIREEEQMYSKSIYTEMILNESVPLLKTALLNKLLMSSHLQKEELVKRLAHLDITLDSPWFRLAIIRISNYEVIRSVYRNDASLAYFALDNVMNESLREHSTAIGFKSAATNNEFVCIFGLEKVEGSREKLTELFKGIIRNAKAYNKLQIDVSISAPCSSLTELPYLYKTVSHIYGKRIGEISSSITHAEQFYEESQLNDLVTVQEIMGLTLHMENNDKQGLMALLNQLFRRVERAGDDRLQNYFKIAAKVYFCCESLLDKYSLQLETLFEDRVLPFNELTVTCEKPIDINMGLVKLTVEVAELISRKKRLGSAGIVEQAVEYIRGNYFEEISLGLLSGKFFLNPTYFSELFKKETGESLSKYVNYVRIEKAKELLGSQNIKPTHVYELVGFSDPAYFSTVFKKMTGLTPGEYARGHLMKMG